MAGVLFDYNAFVRASRGGVARYFCNIFAYLQSKGENQDALDFTVIAPLHNNEMLHDAISNPLANYIPMRGRIPNKSMETVNEAVFRAALSLKNPRIVHESHYSGRSYSRRAVKVVYTVHDMIPELFPELLPGYGKIAARRKMAFLSDADFVCVSQRTADDLMTLFPVRQESVHVIHHGTTILDLRENVSRREDMLLYVGTRGAYKNFTNLVEGLGRIRKLAEEIELVAFGGGAFTSAEKALLERHGIKRYRQIAGNDHLLARAYAQATAFVYPSLYEGFGLPLLEAMAMNCPVVCARASCFPEIAAEAAAYFDPNDPADIGYTLQQILEDPQSRDSLALQGRERSKAFQWSQSAEAHADLYRILGA